MIPFIPPMLLIKKQIDKMADGASEKERKFLMWCLLPIPIIGLIFIVLKIWYDLCQ